MAVDISKHTDPEPAEQVVQTYSHPAADPIRTAATPDTETLLNHIEDKAKEVLAKFEGTVMDVNQVMNMKQELQDTSHLIGSVGVNVLEDVAQVAIQVLLRGMQSWINAEVSIQAPAGEGEPTTPEQPKMARRGGKAVSGTQGTAPYAEAPNDKAE